MSSQNLLIRKLQIAMFYPPPVDLRAVCWQNSEEIGQREGTSRETGGYFTLVRAMNLYEREVSENTMFLDWGEEKVVVQE